MIKKKSLKHSSREFNKFNNTLNGINKNGQSFNNKDIPGANDNSYPNKNLFNNAKDSNITYHEKEQDVNLRKKYSDAISKALDFQENLRRKLAKFYEWYISIVTACIFLVIIDPVAIIRRTKSYYSNSIKELLIGAFFANILSILMIMFRFSFTSIKSMTDQFKNIGNKYLNHLNEFNHNHKV